MRRRFDFISASEEDGFIVRSFKKWDEQLLHWTLNHPYKVIVGAALLFFLTMATLPFVGTSFLPDFNEGTLTINVLAQPGTSLAESNKIGQIAEKLILEVPEVISTGRRTGRAELDEHAEGVHYTEIDVDLKESDAHARRNSRRHSGTYSRSFRAFRSMSDSRSRIA